ncbi:Zn-ribbon domain-containing protein [Halorussus amylolyticus]|uniref:Zn-ribbon domain-containing protein n=1 Tax=Halorussus amylolyticus TaxID=1126242 RepID=UPI00104BF141|nr:Zn-ribbon containing protein [Halorussus amylolyticus]
MPHQCTNCGRAFEDGSKEMLSGCPDCGGNKFQFLPASAMDGAEPANGGAGATSASAGVGATTGGTAPKKAPEDSAGAQSGANPSADASASTGAESSASKTGSSASKTEEEDRPGAMNRAAKTVRDWVRTGSEETENGRKATENGRKTTERPNASENGTSEPAPEDTAQASARSDIVTEAELPDDASRASTAETESSTAAGTSETAETPAAADPPEDAEVIDTPDENAPGLKELREELNSQFESIRIAEPGQYELNLMELFEREEYIIALQEDGKYVIEVPDGWETPDR